MEIFLWSFLFDYDTKICKKRTISLMFPAFLIIVFFFTIIAISLKKKPFSHSILQMVPHSFIILELHQEIDWRPSPFIALSTAIRHLNIIGPRDPPER